MKVVIGGDERYPDYWISRAIKTESDYGDVVDIPKEFYALFKKIEAQRDLTQQLASAYVRKDNLSIIELTAKLKGLVK